MDVTTSPNVGLDVLAADYDARRDPESLRDLRARIVQDPGHDAGIDLRGAVAALCAGGDHVGAVTLVRSHMPGAFFSPSAHALLAAAYAEMGEERSAATERRIACLALDSVLNSGDGTLERPWSVLRVSDEYDVLRARGRTSQRQTQVTRHGRALDHHRLDDGSEAWFDISLFFGR